nr:MAG TPA: hypothetical protein [Caudoviricetes sp.]
MKLFQIRVVHILRWALSPPEMCLVIEFEPNRSSSLHKWKNRTPERTLIKSLSWLLIAI